MDKGNIDEILNKVLLEYPNLFILEWVWVNDKKIKVTVDGDESVNVKDCVSIGRKILEVFEEDGKESLSLEVSSPDANKPLIKKRQYKKHIGRNLEALVIEDETKVTGELIEVNENGISLEWEERVPKTIGKGKQTVTNNRKLLFEEIKEAKVLLRF